MALLVVRHIPVCYLQMVPFSRVSCGVLSCTDDGGYQPPKRACNGNKRAMLLAPATPNSPRSNRKCKVIMTVPAPANQRAGTDRLAESGYLLNDRRAGQASSGGWAAWNLLLSLIKVAPELAVELLASGAIYECRQLHWIQ